ncbi:MAG: serine hydroxymethyltransferase [Candidatus Daviesbacteria bacterium]
MVNKFFELIKLEEQRQRNGLEMIPSENYVSRDILKALGSILVDKYSEGFPHVRYYGGNEIIDQVEEETKRLANELFGTKHAIVQPYSGSPANLAVDLGLVEPGGVILGMGLSSGGHLTHGASVSYTGKLFKAINYGVGKDGKIDFEEVEKLAREHKPKLIWAGITAYPYILDFEKFEKIADDVGAYLVADISHLAGLIIGGVHPSPVNFVDIITTTTHKTLRGPRGAMILVTEKGLKKDPDIVSKLEKSVFPGLQGGPHNNQTAAIGIALQEAATPEFKEYAAQIVQNAKVLAENLGTYTENHLLLWDLEKFGFGMGYQAQVALEVAGITVNKNTVPGEKASPFYPSGIRLGTAALTSRGMKEEEMKKIATWIKLALEEIKGHDLPKVQEERREFIKNFKAEIAKNENLKKIKEEIAEFAKNFPVPGID